MVSCEVEEIVFTTMPTMEEAYRHRGSSLPQQPMMALSNRCAGCSAVDVPLLACDDIDESGNVADPSQRARYVNTV